MQTSNLRRFPQIARTVTTMAPIEQYWTFKQVAERLHAGESTVKKWAGSGRLKIAKAGKKTLITESALQEFIRTCTAEAAR